MDGTDRLSPLLRQRLEEKGVDIALSLSILDGYNSGALGHEPRLEADDIPSMDSGLVQAMDADLSVSAVTGALRLNALGLSDLADDLWRGSLEGCRPGPYGTRILSPRALKAIGLRLLPLTAFGVLSGGGATTFIDHKKNKGLDPDLFSRFERQFEELARAAEGKPKGVTAAFINPDGSHGPGYLRLKQRALLLAIKAWEASESRRLGRPVRAEEAPGGGFPLRPFQMSSCGNDAILREYLAGALDDPLTARLIDETRCDVSRFLTGVQPMISAFSHSSEGETKRLYDHAWGKEDSPIALPGGHGQNFRVLAEVYRSLRAEGKRWAWLCNVDNLGALPSTFELGVMALTGAQAGFDFSFRTPVDVKGGILLSTASGKPACGDIGSAISFEDVLELERRGKRVLFNCATGLFDLDWLCSNLEKVCERIPVRFSDQDKDAGRYSQAEQNTWEILSIPKKPLVFAVEKSERFLAAKMLLESILTSLAAPEEKGPPAWETGKLLRAGLEALLAGPYGLALRGERRVPKESLAS